MDDQIVPILMPKWGLSMSEGTLASWHVDEGIEIAPGDEIMDVETDKIANVVEAADGGLLRRKVAVAGEIYPVRALLGVMAPASVPDADIDAYIASFEVPEIDEDEDVGPAYEFVDLNGTKIRYVEKSGEGVPFLLIHGFGGDLDNWLFNIDAIAASAPVFALDLPGHGQSSKSMANPDLAKLADSVLSFMDQLKIQQTHMVGHSMGGQIVGQIIATNPDRVKSGTLICSAGLGEEINSSEYIDNFVAASNRKELKPALKLLFADENMVSRAMVDDLLKYKRLDGVDAFLTKLNANLFDSGKQRQNMISHLEASDCPLVVIWGAEDSVIPKFHADALSNATVTVIEGAGHMVQMEESATVNDLILSQLR